MKIQLLKKIKILQHSEGESNSENPGIQGQENPTVGQETTLRPSPAQG